jgi:Ca2+-binding RTX toxin-like protein
MLNSGCITARTFLLFLACGFALSLPVSAMADSNGSLPSDVFMPLSPTLPNEKLDFSDESHESCCAIDYTANGKPLAHRPAEGFGGLLVVPGATSSLLVTGLVKNAFEQANPRYQGIGASIGPVTCSRFADLPQQASSQQGPSPIRTSSLPIAPYSTNVSMRPGALYITDPTKRNTSDFHVEASGGDSRVALQDVQNYSVCMGRGRNEVMAVNSDNGSIMAYNGDNHILLSGNSTNMLTWTGEGEDTIEIDQATLSSSSVEWTAYNIYKTAVSGGNGSDHLLIQNTPPGTKWCHIGMYKLYGETFHIVEFALPPTVTQGPRRQRINIGQTVESVTFKGRTYALHEFLSHGTPSETVAQTH